MSSSATRSGCPLLILLKLLVHLASLASAGIVRGHTVAYYPPQIRGLTEGENRTVGVRIGMTKGQMAAHDDDAQWRIGAKSLDDIVADVIEEDPNLYSKANFSYNDTTRFYTLDSTITVRAGVLGKTEVQVKLVRAVDWLEEEWSEPFDLRDLEDHEALKVSVKRPDSAQLYAKLFISGVASLMIIANTMMGCELDLHIVWSTIQRPVAPLIGFFTQFLIMPLLAYSIAQSVFVPYGQYSAALGLFITGCAPGGGASNFWTLLLDGNVNLSVTMTFLSTLASLVMMPLWMFLLGHNFLLPEVGDPVNGVDGVPVIHPPYGRIATSLGTLVGPLLLGIVIAKYRPTWAVKLRKALRPFVIFVLLFLVVFGSLTSLHLLRFITWRAVFGSLLLPWCGFMFGCFAAILARRPPSDVTAIAIETGIQNTGISIVVLMFSFLPPDSEISTLVPIFVACFTPGPLMLGAAVHLTMKKLKVARSMEVADMEKDGIALRLPSEDRPQTGLIPVMPNQLMPVKGTEIPPAV